MPFFELSMAKSPHFPHMKGNATLQEISAQRVRPVTNYSILEDGQAALGFPEVTGLGALGIMESSFEASSLPKYIGKQHNWKNVIILKPSWII